MKKIAVAAALALMTGAVFAQNMDQPRMGMGMMGQGPVPGVEWKVGTVVTTEYKKVTGQLILDQRLKPVLKADGVEYLLMLPRRVAALLDVKNGDTITVEGLATTVKAETKVQPVFHALKVTIKGQETDLTTLNQGGGGMMGRDSNDRGDNRMGGRWN